MRGFARIACAVPVCRVADVEANTSHVLALSERAEREGAAVVVFPELALSGYTARDLFLDRHLQTECLEGLDRIVRHSEGRKALVLVGLPLRLPGEGRLFNVVAAVSSGKLLGLVPKSYLPTYGEFEEARWFQAGARERAGRLVRVLGEDVPFGTDQLFASAHDPDLVVGVEICEDLWVPVQPGALAALAGATVICNPSASNFVLGKAEVRRLHARSLSARAAAAYAYVAAGPGESSTDLAFDADAFVCEDGEVVAESPRFVRDDRLLLHDVDVEALVRQRARTGTFGDSAQVHARPVRTSLFAASTRVAAPLRRKVERHPLVPHEPSTLARRCWEVFEIQTNALATRLASIGNPRPVLGVSGGLDSTHAALVCAGALDLLGRPRSELLCITMPGFGTTAATKGNAERLVESLGAELRTIDVGEASRLVLELVGHEAAEGTKDVAALIEKLRANRALGDVALENVQARLRTLVLMTIANAERGLVIGTGDLSEKALGWSTYAGDHISMYDVNAGVPKTLIQSVIRWVANERTPTWSSGDPAALRETLFAILETPISPELLPADADGSIAQLTESTLGPYEVHDFFLFHFVGKGARPTRILELAELAFEGSYDRATLQKHLATFLRRFFHNQFKRSCTADAPKVLGLALSPRGDWRMPSDAEVRAYLAEIEAYPPER